MKKFPLYSAVLIVLMLAVAQLRASGNFRPAMIGNGADSLAARLHYPEKAKRKMTQGAVTFYCEVGTDGKAEHVEVIGAKNKGALTAAVENALEKGRFRPAMSDGKPVPVMIGGTILFLFHDKQPIIAVSLSTADKEKTAALGNYIQPQMIGSNADFRRKLIKSQYDIHLRGGQNPSAEVLVQVDAQGNLTSTKILAQSPPDGGWGPLMVKAMKGAKFIPAMKNGSPVAGEFNLPLIFKGMRDPDSGPDIGSHINDDSGSP